MTESSIHVRVKRCLELSRGLFQLVESTQRDITEDALVKLRDQQSRFAVWSGNIGAQRSGTSSLEYRLRDASHIKENVISLLDEFQSLIEDAQAILSGTITPWDQLSDEESEAKDDADRDGVAGAVEEDMPDTELDQIALDVAEVVDGLLSLSMSIRNPAPHDRFIASLPTETSHFEAFDIEHVHSSFASLSPWLAERLGKANSRRRQYFKYRQAHHEKLAYGMDTRDDATVAPSTIASSIPEKMKSGDRTGIDVDDDSDDGATQTSFATSVANAQRHCVPPLPSEAEKGPFECPFCFMLIIATNRTSWKKHVYGDLRPYVCLEKHCTTADQEFGRRHEWINHVRQTHWTLYQCPAGCDETFRSAVECRKHLDKVHSGQFSAQQADGLVKLNAQPASIPDRLCCPLCGELQSSLKRYQRHVGRHQERLSLFALPSSEIDDNMETKGREDQSGIKNLIQDDEESAEHEWASQGSFESSHSSRIEILVERNGVQISSTYLAWEQRKTGDSTTGNDERELLSSPPNTVETAFEHPESDHAAASEMYHKRVGKQNQPAASAHSHVDAMRALQTNRESDASKAERRPQLGGVGQMNLPPKSLPAAVTAELLNRLGISDKNPESSRPTYTRMARRHISLETLRHFGVDFQIDRDPEHVIVKRWVTLEEQDQFWKHTRAIRYARGVMWQRRDKSRERTVESAKEARGEKRPRRASHDAGVRPAQVDEDSYPLSIGVYESDEALTP